MPVVSLGSFNLLRFLGFVIAFLGTGVFLPWCIGAVVAPEYMLNGKALEVGLIAAITMISGFAIYRLGHQQEVRKETNRDSDKD